MYVTYFVIKVIWTHSAIYESCKLNGIFTIFNFIDLIDLMTSINFKNLEAESIGSLTSVDSSLEQTFLTLCNI